MTPCWAKGFQLVAFVDRWLTNTSTISTYPRIGWMAAVCAGCPHVFDIFWQQYIFSHAHITYLHNLHNLHIYNPLIWSAMETPLKRRSPVDTSLPYLAIYATGVKFREWLCLQDIGDIGHLGTCSDLRPICNVDNFFVHLDRLGLRVEEFKVSKTVRQGSWALDRPTCIHTYPYRSIHIYHISIHQIQLHRYVRCAIHHSAGPQWRLPALADVRDPLSRARGFEVSIVHGHLAAQKTWLWCGIKLAANYLEAFMEMLGDMCTQSYVFR